MKASKVASELIGKTIGEIVYNERPSMRIIRIVFTDGSAIDFEDKVPFIARVTKYFRTPRSRGAEVK